MFLHDETLCCVSLGILHLKSRILENNSGSFNNFRNVLFVTAIKVSLVTIKLGEFLKAYRIKTVYDRDLKRCCSLYILFNTLHVCESYH